MTNEEVEAEAPALGARRLATLQFAVLVVALCGIVYELIIAAVSSYLLGSSVTQFSITIGLFMFAMGIGSYLSKHVRGGLLATFVAVEIILALVGGASSTALFLVFPYRSFYVPVMYALTLVIGALVGLEIPIIMRILATSGGVRRSVAHVLSLDYLGALIGSVAFPLLLLPHLGLFRASFAIGLLNAAVALVTVVVFRNQLARAWWYAAATVAATVLLTAGIVLATRITDFAEGRLYVDRIVHRVQTPYQRVVVTRNDRTGEHALYLDGHVQFAERDEHRYHEALVHPVLGAPGSRARVLVLGGGDGLAVREILKHAGVERVCVVDIDPAVVEIARTFPPILALNRGLLDDPRVTVVHEDAFAFVRDVERGADAAGDRVWDRVIIDLPDPHDEALAKLYSVEMYRLIARRLAPGLVVTQSSSPFFTREVFWSIAATMEDAGLATTSYHITVPSFGDWGFTLAAAGSEPPTLGLDNTVERRFLTDEVLQAARIFGRDVARIDAPVNSIFRPVISDLYRQGLP